MTEYNLCAKNKRLRITFTETDVKYEIVCNGHVDLLKTLSKMADVEYITIGDQLAKKHGIESIEYQYK